MADTDLTRLDAAIIRVAQLIDDTGTDYWPILDRLETERSCLLDRQLRLARHLSDMTPAHSTVRRMPTFMGRD